jgi:pyrroloquinoline quinone biosynthesis protein D
MAPISNTIGIHEQSCPKLASKALLRFDRYEQRVLLLYPERGLLLNEAASDVLRLCNGKVTIGTIVNVLFKTYPASAPDDILNDVLAFLSQLHSRGLIEV